MHRTLAIATFSALFAAALAQSCASRVPHDEEHRFPLEGVHAAITCESCHGLDGFEALPTECQACHEVDRPPGHYEGQDCVGCHTAYGWLVFTEPTGEVHPCQEDHDACLPLIDSHAITCSECHVDPTAGYAGLDATCESCHAAERPPYHYVGEDCAHCHLPTVWTDGQEHPITLPHFEAVCESCHPTPAERTNFTCTTGCHEQAETDVLHDNVYGYLYADASCYQCHPDGLQ